MWRGWKKKKKKQTKECRGLSKSILFFQSRLSIHFLSLSLLFAGFNPYLLSSQRRLRKGESMKTMSEIEGQGGQKAPEEEEDAPINIAAVFAAAAAGDAAALTAALAAPSGPGANAAASYQDPATGRSPLFAAAEADSVECVAVLLEAGAPWNATDRRGRCAGDAAVAKGCSDAAGALLEAGVRAELVLGALSEASAAATEATSSSSSLPAAEEGRPYLAQRATFHASASASDGNAATLLSDEQGRAVMMEWEAGIMKATAHAVAKGARRNGDGSGGGVGASFLFFVFLFSRSRSIFFFFFFSDAKKLKNLFPFKKKKTVLNIGHGLGLVDAAIREYNPRKHVICEPHPDVLARMRETGWLNKSENGEEATSAAANDDADKSAVVVVIPKRWQEALSDGDLEAHGPFDGVFYDPFDDGEIDVFLKALPRLLSKKDTSVASFFNGLCSDNAFFHAVAGEVVRRKLAAAGLECDFVPLPLQSSATSEETWGGVTNRYWQLETYNLPVITWREEEEEEEGEKKEEEEEEMKE